MISVISGIDQQVMIFIQQLGGNIIFDYIAMFLAFLGDNGLVWLLPAFVLLFFKQYRAVGIMVIICMAITALEVELLKNIVARPRPFVSLGFGDMLINEAPYKSFPSGHASSAFAAATIYAFSFKKYKWWFIGGATLIAVSRLYLMAHYPSDVIVGAVIGIINGVIIYTIYKKYVQKRKISEATE